MKVFGRVLAAAIPAFFIAGMALAADYGSPETATAIRAGDKISVEPTVVVKSADEATAFYGCNLKVYMVEKESRYIDNTAYYHYDYGLLDFAFDTVLSLNYEETFQQTKIWDARAAGFASTADSIYVRQDNMMAIAVVFNSEDGPTKLSDPYFEYAEDGAPFIVHYVDASAAATDGHPGYDTAYGAYTHTVFLEEATAYT